MAVLVAARQGHYRATGLTEGQMAASQTVIPPEYRPTPSSTRCCRCLPACMGHRHRANVSATNSMLAPDHLKPMPPRRRRSRRRTSRRSGSLSLLLVVVLVAGIGYLLIQRGVLPARNRARAHLLGRQLGGTGELPANLVALYQTRANTPVMRDYETTVAEAAHTGE